MRPGMTILPGDVADVRVRRHPLAAHARDLAAGKGDVGNRVDVLRRVDDATIPQDQIVGNGNLSAV